MRIGIVTVYNSLNCGSFLQAYAMSEVLKENGHQPIFLNTKTRHPHKVSVAKAIGCFKHLQLKDAYKALKSYAAYRNCVSKLTINAISENTSLDAFILGSDEIWNMHRRLMSAYPIFVGDGLPLDRTIAYSPSVNTATYDELNSSEHLKKALNGLAAISVRDAYSKEQLGRLTDREISLCCDPTMLCDRDVYDVLIKDLKLKDFLFVYEYDRLTKEDISFIKQYAEKNSLKTVAMGADHKWAEVSVESDPGKFLYLIKNAKTVITGTFHGTVFSIIYRTPIISLARGNRKIHEILSMLQLEDRKCDTSNYSSAMLRIKELDDTRIYERIAEMRKESEKFLFGTLMRIEQKGNKNA